MTRNLIISPIGDRSQHRTWLGGPGKPDFDLFLIYYGDGPDDAQRDAKYYLRRKGFKYEHLRFVADEFADALSKYERIWCPDDDIASTTADLNLLFSIFDKYNLKLAQPAIARGDFSFKSLVQQRGKLLRYSPYIEVMCPLFSREAFFDVKQTFLESRSGWGLDWVWPKRFAPHEVAIIDKVGIDHTGPLGMGEHYKSLAKIGIDPFRDFRETVARYGGIDWKIHRRMLRGRMRMKFVPDPDDRRTLIQRAHDYIRWLRLRRSAVGCRSLSNNPA